MATGWLSCGTALSPPDLRDEYPKGSKSEPKRGERNSRLILREGDTTGEATTGR